jgi:hypothetical protein
MDPLEHPQMHPLIGVRVKLLSTTDPHTNLKPGALGSVRFVDDAGTVFVQWDAGNYLGLIEGEDRWEVVR